MIDNFLKNISSATRKSADSLFQMGQTALEAVQAWDKLLGDWRGQKCADCGYYMEINGNTVCRNTMWMAMGNMGQLPDAADACPAFRFKTLEDE